MIPDTFGAFLAFLGLVAPGVLFNLIVERRQPRRDESAFRETSTVALASLCFTLVSVLLLAALWSVARPLVPDVPAWIAGGNRYISQHFTAVFAGISLEVAIASALGIAVAWLMTWRSDASISRRGVWYQVLRHETPPGKRPWVHVRLDDETEFWGYLRHYTPECGAAVREIVLGGTTLAWRRKGEVARSTIGHSWDAVCVNADRIQYLRVIYTSDTDERLFGRRTRQNPGGRERSAVATPRQAPAASGNIHVSDGDGSTGTASGLSGE